MFDALDNVHGEELMIPVGLHWSIKRVPLPDLRNQREENERHFMLLQFLDVCNREAHEEVTAAEASFYLDDNGYNLMSALGAWRDDNAFEREEVEKVLEQTAFAKNEPCDAVELKPLGNPPSYAAAMAQIKKTR